MLSKASFFLEHSVIPGFGCLIFDRRFKNHWSRILSILFLLCLTYLFYLNLNQCWPSQELPQKSIPSFSLAVVSKKFRQYSCKIRYDTNLGVLNYICRCKDKVWSKSNSLAAFHQRRWRKIYLKRFGTLMTGVPSTGKRLIPEFWALVFFFIDCNHKIYEITVQICVYWALHIGHDSWGPYVTYHYTHTCHNTSEFCRILSNNRACINICYE